MFSRLCLCQLHETHLWTPGCLSVLCAWLQPLILLLCCPSGSLIVSRLMYFIKTFIDVLMSNGQLGTSCSLPSQNIFHLFLYRPVSRFPQVVLHLASVALELTSMSKDFPTIPIHWFWLWSFAIYFPCGILYRLLYFIYNKRADSVLSDNGSNDWEQLLLIHSVDFFSKW